MCLLPPSAAPTKGMDGFWHGTVETTKMLVSQTEECRQCQDKIYRATKISKYLLIKYFAFLGLTVPCCQWAICIQSGMPERRRRRGEGEEGSKATQVPAVVQEMNANKPQRGRKGTGAGEEEKNCCGAVCTDYLMLKTRE